MPAVKERACTILGEFEQAQTELVGNAVILTGHLGRCHLKGREGDAANVTLTAVGHNLRAAFAPSRQSDGLLNGRLSMLMRKKSCPFLVDVPERATPPVSWVSDATQVWGPEGFKID